MEEEEDYRKERYGKGWSIGGGEGEVGVWIGRVKGERGKWGMGDMGMWEEGKWGDVEWNGIEWGQKDRGLFEYQKDDLGGFYEKKYEFLGDLKEEVWEVVWWVIEIEGSIEGR